MEYGLFTDLSHEYVRRIDDDLSWIGSDLKHAVKSEGVIKQIGFKLKLVERDLQSLQEMITETSTVEYPIKYSGYIKSVSNLLKLLRQKLDKQVITDHDQHQIRSAFIQVAYLGNAAR